MQVHAANSMLYLDAVSVAFDGFKAINNLSLTVDPGEMRAVIGPNGAGKTTMMRAITGIVRPNQGSISLAGQRLNRLPTHRRVRLGLGLSQQLVRPFHEMSVLDNVVFAAGYRKTGDPVRALLTVDRQVEVERALALIESVGIADHANDPPAAMPLGVLKRLEVARALALEPKVLLLDEPLAGLNSAEAAALADTVVDLNRQGLTVVLIEHNLGEVMRVCERLVVLDNGRKIGDGPAREVMADPVVRDAYLGVGHGANDAAA
jgi:branched-chain amino acid transport system ATP-binding protein